MKKSSTIWPLLLLLLSAVSESLAAGEPTHWVDSVYQRLTMPEKLGQTIWLELKNFPNETEKQIIQQHIQKGKIGGIIFHSGHENETATFIRNLRATAPYPVRFYCGYSDLTVSRIQSKAKFLDPSYFEGAPEEAVVNYAETLAQLNISQGFDGIIFQESWKNELNPAKTQAFLDGLRKTGLKVIANTTSPGITPDGRYLTSTYVDTSLKPKKLYKQYSDKEEFEIGTLNQEDWLVEWLNADVVILSSDYIDELDRFETQVYNNKWYRKILQQKSKQALAWHGIRNIKPISLENLYAQDRINIANFDLMASAVVIATNSGSLPYQSLDAQYAVLKRTPISKVANYTSRYVETNEFYLPDYTGRLEQLLTALVNTNYLIVEYGPDSWSEDLMRILHFLKSEIDITFLVDETSRKVEEIETLGNIVWVKNNYNKNIDIATQVLFGAMEAKGKLPYDLTAAIKAGSGFRYKPIPVVKHTFPAYVNADQKKLDNINDIVAEAIASGAFPGCQIAVVKDNHVIYNKSFGYFTYDSVFRVTDETIYDLASVTKVAATLQAVMFLTEQGIINLDDSVGKYLPEAVGTNKSPISIRKLLLHEAGLKAYLPFWKVSIEKDQLSSFTYQSKYDSIMGIKTYGLYYPTIQEKEIVWQEILNSELRTLRNGSKEYDYLYSDLGFMILQMIVEKVTNQNIDEFLAQNVYAPLGLVSMTFNPLTKFHRSLIAPTEYDYYFRNAQIWGTVHDQNAAVLGGVSGHAGLFSNSLDLAKLLQMNLNGGIYGKYKYIHDYTLNAFTARQHAFNRRGLGWDKPDVEIGHVSLYASPDTYGHSGFTGTSVWVDPKENLIFVFLSNRVFPNASNRKLMEDNIRTRIQDVIYEAIGADI